MWKLIDRSSNKQFRCCVLIFASIFLFTTGLAMANDNDQDRGEKLFHVQKPQAEILLAMQSATEAVNSIKEFVVPSSPTPPKDVTVQEEKRRDIDKPRQDPKQQIQQRQQPDQQGTKPRLNPREEKQGQTSLERDKERPREIVGGTLDSSRTDQPRREDKGIIVPNFKEEIVGGTLDSSRIDQPRREDKGIIVPNYKEEHKKIHSDQKEPRQPGAQEERRNCWDTSTQGLGGCTGIVIDSSRSIRRGAGAIWSNQPIGTDMHKARFESHVAASGPITSIINVVGETGTLVQSVAEQADSFSGTGYGHLLGGSGQVGPLTIFSSGTPLFDFARYRAGAVAIAPHGGADGNVMQLCEFMANVKAETTMYGIVYVEVDINRDNGASTAHVGEPDCQPPAGYQTPGLHDTGMAVVGQNETQGLHDSVHCVGQDCEQFDQKTTQMQNSQNDNTHSGHGEGNDTVAGGGSGGSSNIPNVNMPAGSGHGGKVKICHVVQSGQGNHVIEISSAELPAHHKHGDYIYHGAIGDVCPASETMPHEGTGGFHKHKGKGKHKGGKFNSDGPCGRGAARLEHGKVDVRGTLIFDFGQECAAGFRIEANVPLLINPAIGPVTKSTTLTRADWKNMKDENTDNTTPSENNWPSGYETGWKEVSQLAPAYSPVGKTLADGHRTFRSPIADDSSAEDLPALMYTDGVFDVHHAANISGVVYTPHFVEIEQLCPTQHDSPKCTSPQVQYINGALIAQHGVWLEDRVNSGGMAINFDPRALNALAAKATPENIGVRGIVER